MSLKEALAETLSDPNKILESVPVTTFMKLSMEDQDALRSYFQYWASANEELSEPASGGGLIALGFILGHNWVKDHWALW